MQEKEPLKEKYYLEGFIIVENSEGAVYLREEGYFLEKRD